LLRIGKATTKPARPTGPPLPNLFCQYRTTA